MKQLLTIFILLLALTCCTTESDRNRMRAGLDSINQRNRNDQPFTVADVEPYVQFFDDHGTPNDRLLAHYLLGRAYYEAGEAPMALECYQEATECADTTDKQCNFDQISRVYSQMGWVFHKQLLFSYEVSARQKSKYYSLIVGDNQMACYETALIASAYILQNKKDSAEIIIRKAIHDFHELKLKQDSIQSSLVLMYLLAEDANRHDEMKQLIDIYDSQSELYDSCHELHSQYRMFYYYKGRYYDNIGKLDSAEYYYRKVYHPRMSYTSKNSMYKGLMSVFTKRQITDSIRKYSILYCNANDSSIAINDRQLTAQMAASYQYGKIQHRMHESETKAHRASIAFFLVLALLVVISIAIAIIWYYFKWQQQKKKQEIDKLKEEFNSLTLLYEKNMKVLQDAQDNYETARDRIASFTEENISLKERIKELLKQESISEMVEYSKKYTKTDIVQRVFVVSKDPRKELGKKDFDDLIDVTFCYYPTLQRDLNKIVGITTQETTVVILVLLNIRTDDIARMLNVSGQRITNIKASMNESLFGIKSARMLSYNLKKHYGIYMLKE